MVAVIRSNLHLHSDTMPKKKRSRQDHEQEEEQEIDSVDEQDAEMEDGDDDKEEDKEEEIDQDEQEQAASAVSSPFLDAFYGLAASDPRERAIAAQTILWHISDGQGASDAPYAWKRLLRGLGSGRAAARQGNASALSTLLKIGMETDLMEKIRQQEQESADDDREASMVEFVRNRLLTATQPPGGKKKKGSIERDALFGRLFGIVGVIRSGVLVEYATHKERTRWLQDLAQLYRTKNWMREPTAHAVCLLLQSCRDKKDCDVAQLVPVVLAEFLEVGDNEAWHGEGAAASTNPLAIFSAEQIALAIFLQCLVEDASKDLPHLFKGTILSTDVLPILATTLASTSHVTPPRTHLLWDVVAMALTSPNIDSGEEKKSAIVDERKLKADPNILESLFKHVVQEQLLGLSGPEKTKATDDRRALALLLVRQWTGVEFVSSLTGRTVLRVPAEILASTVLVAPIVRRLFVDLVSTKDHYLKPLAFQVLQQMTEYAITESPEGRTAFIKAFLSASTRFDAKTKSCTLSTLLGWQSNSGINPEDLKPIWESVLVFCEEGICGVVKEDDKNSLTPNNAAGLVDVLFHHAQFLVRLAHPGGKGDEETMVPDFVNVMIQKIRSFFFAMAFFDCRAVKTEKNKNTVVKMAAQFKEVVLPYDLRCVISARYYSLLAEQVAADLHGSGLTTAVRSVHGCVDDWQKLVKAGAKPHGDSEKTEESPEEEEGDESPDQIISHLQELLKSFSDSPQKGIETFLLSTNLLASILYLHILNCGAPDNVYEDDDPDIDPADDMDEVENYVQDVYDVARQFLKLSSDGTSTEEETCPLTIVAGLCINILSSPLTSGNHFRGAAPKILREAVRQLWIQGMMTASQSNVKADPDLLGMLLDALGAKVDSLEDMEDAEEDEGDSDATEEDEDFEQTVFAKAAAMADVNTEMKDDTNNSDSDDNVHEGKTEESEDENEEIKVDDSRLQSLLEEDDDASVNATELEHHAGADAALARLIKLKQEARKAGQKAREKIEISNNTRCVILLESLLMGKPEGWGSILSPNLILSAIVPLLERRRSLERDLSKLTEGGKDAVAGEKRGLLDRITSLLRQRVLKTRVSSFSWSSKANPKELVLDLGQTLVKQAKERNSKEHSVLVSALLAFAVKALPDSEKVETAKEIYSHAVEEWSSKRSNRLQAKIFEDLIHQASGLSLSVLAQPLANAAGTAKTAFLKTESFKLLTLLLNPKLHQVSGDTEQEKVDVLTRHTVDAVINACASALQDAEMKKAKRAREVLKTLARSLDFSEFSECWPTPSSVKEVKASLQSFCLDSESQGLKAVADKLMPRLDSIEEEEEEEEEETKAVTKKAKKSKKKKGKKKR